MFKFFGVWALLLAATAMEASGDAVVRIGLFEKTGAIRAGVLVGGAALLFAYGVLLNLTPLPFERVVGLYIATLFVVWQFVTFFTFRTIPRAPVLLGGMLIVVGGLLVTFWSAGPNHAAAASS
jgi:small multidrug resistance family-3 protein